MKAVVVFVPLLMYTLGVAAVLVVFSPFVMIAGGIVAVLMFTERSSKNHAVERRSVLGMDRHRMAGLLAWLGMGVAFAAYTFGFLWVSGFWLHAKPTGHWKDRIKNADSAIILGFGLEKGSSGTLTAGRANEFLLDWTLRNTPATTLLVQEGVRLAATSKDAALVKGKGVRVVRIHRHNDKEYVDTLQAAYFALKTMSALGKRKAVLVAHPLQLQRALWDLERARDANEQWKRVEFVVPEIPDTPFPDRSIHWQTRGEYRYKLVELFWSRPRDLLDFRKPPFVVGVAGRGSGKTVKVSR